MEEAGEPQLTQLAHTITQAGWRPAALLMLDLLGPLDVISSQAVLFARPLLHGTSLDPYAQMLSEPANWHRLRQLLAL
ncbi:hypothetical protein [Candidatus Oscillochloris fontis]|uniref:hypothetical protein n=1 Tax=Candidatus Oscillochloris fontis TaxID=2496868 RepID=UPI00101C8BE9|nr:hypothetical protein [Candidatus Oscillochloris fontis]